MAGKTAFLFQYTPKNTYIHRLPAGIKFCALCLSSFTLYGAAQKLLAVYAVCLLLVCICAKLSASTLQKNIRFLCVYALVIFVIKVLGVPLTATVLVPLAIETGFFIERLTLILFAASVFYETTSKLELFTLCETIERFIRKEKYTGAFSALFTITLMCIPQVFETWAQLTYAYTARTPQQKRGLLNAYQQTAALLPALIENLLRFALTAEQALKNRT